MNPPTIVEPDAPGVARRNLSLGAGALALALLTAIALAFVLDRSGGPGTVPRLTFENPTAYAIEIDVSPGTGTGWISVGSVRQGSTADISEVTDQGDVWQFRFRSQGQTGGELRLTRAELEAAGWRIAIPAEVGSRIAETGAPPTP